MTVSDTVSSTKYSVSIIGASGYSGAELTRLLLKHPQVELRELYAFSQAGNSASELYPALSCDKIYKPYGGETESDIYFLALPHGEALQLVPALLQAGKTVIDLSGDFRLKSVAEHEQFYKQTKSPDAVMTYGMPELYHDDIRAARAISNPGCFATSIILGVAPLFLGNERWKKALAINCTSTSGISGAGRSGKTELSFSEMSENIREFYRNAPFVRVRDTMTEVKHVYRTNYCDIHIAHATASGSVVIVTAIDNLLKGAAGQAVQNMNIMLGIDETSGLL